jgi:prevent-host-death family protein
MTEEISLKDARGKLGDLVERAHRNGQATCITRYGTRVAVIVPADLCEHVHEAIGDKETQR